MKNYFFKRLFGKKYLINLKTLEIHSLENQHPNCKLDLMAKHNKEFITEKHMLKLLNNSSLHDGCRWCMKEQDNG